jgi:hypothetical protein
MFEIGNSLREARLRQQLEFSKLEQMTKVRPKYLRALEDEQFDVLPAPTYVKGFLKAYADALGLDGQLYVDEFNSRFVVGEDEAPFRPKRSASTRAARRVETSAVLVSLAAIGLVTGALLLGLGGGHAKKVPAGAPRSALPELPAVTPAPKVKPKKARPVVRTKLVLTAARGSCWLEVRQGSSAGRQLFVGTLAEGESMRFVARRLWISAGAVASLDATVNGRAAALQGTGSPAALLIGPHGQLTG